MHEAIVQIIRNAPRVIGELLARESWPEGAPIYVSQTEFVDLNHAEYRADHVLLHGPDPAGPRRANVLEVQLTIDPDKPDRWQLFVAGYRPRLVREGRGQG